MILAGDIGGTHTRIALFQQEAARLKLMVEHVYPSREHKSLDEIVSLFMSDEHVHVDHACFGVAGPVLHGEVSTPNLAWVVSAVQLARQIGIETVWLINDLQAHASGIDDLAPEDFIALNTIDSGIGNAALIAAGTGLGEAGLYWDGVRRWPFPCEGGHTDFAPRNDIEITLLQYLLKKFGRVSYERVLSGPGLLNIYEFLRDTRIEEEAAWLKDELARSTDPAALISEYGLKSKTPICERVLDIFVSVYGAEAGNLALKIMATGGLFVSGGIAGKILPKMTNGTFLEVFISKGRLQPVMETIPVKIIVNERIGLIGAARYAAMQQDAQTIPVPPDRWTVDR